MSKNQIAWHVKTRDGNETDGGPVAWFRSRFEAYREYSLVEESSLTLSPNYVALKVSKDLIRAVIFQRRDG